MSRLEDEFNEFHHGNPQVYELFKRFAFQAIAKGFGAYSARTLIHLIRWHTSVETSDPDGFKVNDHHSPYYSRLFMRDYPEHGAFFRTKDLPDDGNYPEESAESDSLFDVNPEPGSGHFFR